MSMLLRPFYLLEYFEDILIFSAFFFLIRKHYLSRKYYAGPLGYAVIFYMWFATKFRY